MPPRTKATAAEAVTASTAPPPPSKRQPVLAPVPFPALLLRRRTWRKRLEQHVHPLPGPSIPPIPLHRGRPLLTSLLPSSGDAVVRASVQQLRRLMKTPQTSPRLLASLFHHWQKAHPVPVLLAATLHVTVSERKAKKKCRRRKVKSDA